MYKDNIIIDCFAGGGGASVGIEMALGQRAVDKYEELQANLSRI